MKVVRSVCCFIALIWFGLITPNLFAGESIWLEAEHLRGIKGYCWPMGQPAMKKTAGHWALSGPGWAAEWNQGGESGFLSIATAADDDHAVATAPIDVPAAGKYFVWVRYGDWREQSEPFSIKIEQPGAAAWTGDYGENAVVDEDNEAKLYWGWAFAWDRREVPLRAGTATLSLLSTKKAAQPRQIDMIVLTTDPEYRPRIKDRPQHPTMDVLDEYRRERPKGLKPLSRAADGTRSVPATIAEAWKVRTFRDKGFLYLWNSSHAGPTADWLLSDEPNRVLFPYGLRDDDAVKELKQKFGGKTDVPIYSDPRIVPTFHGAGPGIFGTDPKTGEVTESGKRFAAWLDKNPDRAWAMMMNYHPDTPIGAKGQELFAKYRDRYVGSISGESIGYFYPNPDAMRAATANAMTRRQLVEAFAPITQAGNRDKYRAVFGKDLDANPYLDVISCLSVGNICWAPILSQWGSRTIGYESATATSSVLNMRWAFMRGIARQGGHTTATYRSCNFGDASTIFSNTGSYHSPQAIFDNYYSVFSGAGMTWYKFDIWYQYMAGSSMFYHEQGFDEFWKPGGTTAAGQWELQLSPKGKLVDRFLRTTAPAKGFDRGSPYTPVAFLVDYAHGWEPAPFWPNSFKNWHGQESKFLFGDHEKMLEEWFWTAYHPIAHESEKPMTGTNEVYLPGVFGDVFDVIVATPDVSRWKTIDTYPVVIANGDIELTAAEGDRLAKYVEQGGTLLVSDTHLTGPGVAALKLPNTSAVYESEGYRWLSDTEVHPSQRFRCRPLAAGQAEWQPLAQTADGKVFCAATDRGKGRLIFLSVPRGFGIDRRVIPVVPRLIAHLTRGLMPIEVEGDVQWLVNRNAAAWMVTLLNPAGQDKPQQGITATDYRQNRPVVIRSRMPVSSAVDRLQPTDRLTVLAETTGSFEVHCEVPAGGVRVIELK